MATPALPVWASPAECPSPRARATAAAGAADPGFQYFQSGATGAGERPEYFDLSYDLGLRPR
jgi:hypothetical protein